MMKYILILVSIGLLSACSDQFEGPYPILDSGIRVGAGTVPKTSWIDNEQVIFIGMVGDKPKTKEEMEKTKPEYAVYIWNIRNNETIMLDAKPKHYGFCYHDNLLVYQDESGWIEMNLGVVGKKIRERGMPDYSSNPYDCRRTWRPESMIGRQWVPLKVEDGYLDYGSQENGDSPNAILFTHELKKNIRMPFRGLSVHIHYSQFDDAYYINESISRERWRKGECAQVWRFNMLGETEKECLLHPHDGSIERWAEAFVVTKKGVALISHDMESVNDMGRAGIYLHTDEKYIRLNRGYVTGTSVSPDGCKIAYHNKPHFHANSPYYKGIISAQVIDICTI
ncbi:MAG: hypothetical protein KZQ80_17715 [Candidatus Thiodiazotropha sp. (ex Monitilora ramsayi)]|nr:hypothetical protein [Candidatus Thiodiazotropha sp. (ex Monitilora ramsayi)]